MGAQPAGDVAEDLLVLGARGQRGQHAHPGLRRSLVEGADQGGEAGLAARGGGGVGQLARAGRRPRVRAAAVAGEHHDAEQPAAGERHAERAGPGRRLLRVGVGVREDAADDRAVRLAFEALGVLFQQPPERERGRRALDQDDVARRGRAVAGDDQPSPVLTAGADDGHQPAGRLVVGGALLGAHGAGARLPAGQQLGRVGPGGVGGQHLVGEVLQHHRPPGEARDLADHLGGRRPVHRQLGEDLVQLLRGPQLGELRVDDLRVHGLGDVDERRLARPARSAAGRTPRRRR